VFGAVGKPDAASLATADKDPVDIGAAAQFAAVFLDQPPEGFNGLTGAAPDHGSPGGLEREGDDLAHLAAIGGFRRQSGVQDPGRPERLNEIGAVVRFEPGPDRAKRLSHPGGETAKAALPGLLDHQLSGWPAPQFAAEQGEEEGRIGLDRADIGCRGGHHRLPRER
jgi:hypothetical protein